MLVAPARGAQATVAAQVMPVLATAFSTVVRAAPAVFDSARPRLRVCADAEHNCETADQQHDGPSHGHLGSQSIPCSPVSGEDITDGLPAGSTVAFRLIDGNARIPQVHLLPSRKAPRRIQ